MRWFANFPAEFVGFGLVCKENFIQSLAIVMMFVVFYYVDLSCMIKAMLSLL